MEEISLEDLLSYFKKKVLVIILITLMAVASMVYYVYYMKVAVYTSSTTMILTNDSSNESITSSDISLNNSLITTYGEIVKSKKVLNTVKDELNLSEDYEELNSLVSVSNRTGTSIIEIFVTHVDANKSANIANAIADAFAEEVVKIYSIENLSIIDEAEVSTIPSNNNDMLQIALAFCGGLFLASGMVFTVYYCDKRIKSKDEVERITNWTVLSLVPTNGGK